ncbi:MAG: ABC transporter permease [Cyclobacteriaceae bacterium]
MTAIQYYKINTQNELLKLRNTFAFWLCIIGGSFIPVIYFIYYLVKFESLIPQDGTNPWDKFLTDQIMSAASLLIPLFIVLITSLIIQVEHKANGLKYLFAQPIPKWSVYFSKLTVVFASIIATYILFFAMMLVVGLTVGAIHSELRLLECSPIFDFPIKLLFRSFIASLGIVGIQFWLSFRFKNFIIPLGIGIVLVITGLIVFQAEEAQYFPYAYNRLSLFALASESDTFQWFPSFSALSLTYFLIFSVSGYIDISRMNVT